MKATHGNIDAVSRIRQLSILCTGHQNSALHVTMVALNFVPRMTMVATLPDEGWIELHAGWNGFGQGCIGWRRLSNCKLLSVYRWSLGGCIEYWIKLRTQTMVASIFEQESRKIPPLWCESLRNLMTLFGKKYFHCITLLYFSHSAPYLTSEPGGWRGNYRLLILKFKFKVQIYFIEIQIYIACNCKANSRSFDI